MSDCEMPRIRVELESMRQAIIHGMHRHCEEMQRLTEQAVTNALNPERIRHAATQQAATLIDEAVKHAVMRYFNEEGSDVIMEHVKSELLSRSQEWLPVKEEKK